MIIDGKHVRAEEGMVLNTGVSFLRLGDWDSADNYHEITIEEYEAIIAKQE